MCRLHWYLLPWMWQKKKDIITPELKKAGSKLVWLRIETDDYDVPGLR